MIQFMLAKASQCLLSLDDNDPIFIGIYRLVAKSLNNGTLQGDGIQYPCQIVDFNVCMKGVNEEIEI
jgi:hypothetical protein